MTKRKRHIRWDRVLFLLVVLAVIIGVPTKFILDKQAEARKNIHMHYVVDGVEYDLNYDEALEFEKYGTLPESTIVAEPLLLEPIVKIDKPKLPELIDLGEFRLTGYCNCEICCGVWAGGPCYNGEMPEAEWTIAVDKDVIPLNSYVMINGHKYKACDTGSAIIGNRIDIYCNTHQECYSDFCNGYAEVYLIVEEEVG